MPRFDAFDKPQRNMLQERDYRPSIPRRNNLDIPQWQFLRILNLSDNWIFWLPKELGTLPSLKELDVSRNFLGLFTPWLWLEPTTIQNNLQSLNISSNNIRYLTRRIGDLRALRRLEVGRNFLQAIPHSIGFLENLEHLDLSFNFLLSLPGSVLYLNLSYLDIQWNPFALYFGTWFCHLLYVMHYTTLPSLVELSATCIRRHRMAYRDGIPQTLVVYLDRAYCCYRCGSACYDSYLVKSGPRCHHFIASNLIAPYIGDCIKFVIYSCFFCAKRS